MLIPLKDVLSRHAPLLTIEQFRSVGDAVRIMIERDYSQLPVVDEAGDYLGVISEQSIVRRLFHTPSYKALLQLTVDHCLMPAEPLSSRDDLFKALDFLKRFYAVIVVDDKRPVGILTHADTTDFFRDFSEGLMIVRAIETKLKQYIESHFPDEESQRVAIQAAIKSQSDRRERPVSSVDHLTLGEIEQVILCRENWPKFEATLQPKDLFRGLIEPVRETRNDLAHFRNEKVQAVELDALRTAQHWLESRPSHIVSEPPSIDVETSMESIVQEHDPRLIYGNFILWLLRNVSMTNIRLTFDETRQLLNDQESFSDLQDVTAWDNSLQINARALAWLGAGWRVIETDMARKTVVFSKSFQWSFADLSDVAEHLVSFAAGLTRPILFGSSNRNMDFRWWLTDNILRVELRVDSGDRDINSVLLEAIHLELDAISGEIGQEIREDVLETLDDDDDSYVLRRLYEDVRQDYEDEESGHRDEFGTSYSDAYNQDGYDDAIGEDGETMHVIEPDNPKCLFIEVASEASRAPEERLRWAVETMLKFVQAFEMRIKDLSYE